jgi:uncharacterized protein YecT (DUF1311 family)
MAGVSRLASTSSLLAVALLPPAAAAQASCYQSAQTQAELTRCAHEAAAGAERRLAVILDELRAALEPEHFHALERVQSSWRGYAREHCRWNGGFYEGGSMQPMVVAHCMASVTDERIRELKTFRCGKPSPPGDCP